MVKCPGCGAELTFDAGTQAVKCPYCATTFNPEELKVKVESTTENVDNELNTKSYSCSSCGATVMTFDETAVTFCSYCGSTAMIEQKLMKQTAPDYVIPFSITKEQAIKAYKNKVSRSLFAPKSMKSDIVVNKFRGIYMPYGIYTVSFHDNCDNSGSVKYATIGNYDYYNDYQIEARIDTDYDGISFDLASKFYDKFSMAIPFNYKEAKPFNINYLSGYYADAKDVNNNIYDGEALKVVRRDANGRLKKEKAMRKYGCYNPIVPLMISSRRVGMFPVYFLAIINKEKNNVYYAVVNGQTGKVAMDLPIVFIKYIIGSLLLAIPFYFLFNFLIVLNPKKVTIFAIVFSLISMFFSVKQTIDIKNHEEHIDDKGYQSVNQKKNKEKASYIKNNLFQIFSIIIGILTLINDPVQDEFYYGAACIALVMAVLSCASLIKQHNRLVSNKLPQLEKRGGDESEG